jgi:hypothetical protein
MSRNFDNDLVSIYRSLDEDRQTDVCPFIRRPKRARQFLSFPFKLAFLSFRFSVTRSRPLITRNPASASVRERSRIMTSLTRIPCEVALTRGSHVNCAIPDDHDCNDRNSEDDQVGTVHDLLGLASARGLSMRASCRANDARRSSHQSYFHYTDRSCSTLTPRPARHCYYSEGDVRCTMRAAHGPCLIADNAAGTIAGFAIHLALRERAERRSERRSARVCARRECAAFFLKAPSI